MYILFTILISGFISILCFAELENKQIFNTEIQALKDENDELVRKVSHLQKQLSAFQCEACNVPIGFAVHYTQGLKIVDAGHRVEYDAILTNSGDGYDVVNHWFQCPVSGYYYFHFSMYSGRMHNMELSSAAIFMDDVRLAGQRMFKQGPGDLYNTASNAIYVFCEAGQNVWVEVVEESQISGDENNLLTVFSGFLLTQDF